MLAIATTSTLVGVTGHPVTVEVHVANGLPSCTIVGLPDAACREARDRVRAAIVSAGLDWPQRRVTINLAPSGVPKIGTALDLAIAAAILAATQQVPAEQVARMGFLGELGLDGTIRSVRGVVPLVAGLRARRERIVVSCGDATNASLVPGVRTECGHTLREVVDALTGEAPWGTPAHRVAVAPPPLPDLADVRGQPVARRVIEVAAAGGHHVLLAGPPGSGKTLLASRLPGLLPPLADEDALEVTAIWSAAGEPVPGALMRRPPFRAPHHSASMVAMTGGGTAAMRPGEISMAHRGVLFLDELGEFPPAVLDALRQPLEERVIRVTRARGTLQYPAAFQLVAATNPCPCGVGGLACTCTPAARQRYQRRLSGPLLDRFDLRVDVARPDASSLLAVEGGESTAVVAARVATARAVAAQRGVATNAAIPGSRLDHLTPLEGAATDLLEQAVRTGHLSGRGVHRIRRVARTLADLDAHEGPVRAHDVETALAFRTDRTPEVAA